MFSFMLVIVIFILVVYLFRFLLPTSNCPEIHTPKLRGFLVLYCIKICIFNIFFNFIFLGLSNY